MKAYHPVEVAQLEGIDEGDRVETNDGDRGVVTAEVREEFTWPGNDETISASSSNEKYIVALMSGGSGVYDAEDLTELGEGSFGDPDHDPTDLEDAEMSAREPIEAELDVPGIDDPGVGFDRLPDGWDRGSVLDAWTSVGATFTSCRAEMAGEIRSPTRFCAALKDEVLGTEEWRGDF